MSSKRSFVLIDDSPCHTPVIPAKAGIQVCSLYQPAYGFPLCNAHSRLQAGMRPARGNPELTVIPAQAGIQVLFFDEPKLDSRLRGNDEENGGGEWNDGGEWLRRVE